MRRIAIGIATVLLAGAFSVWAYPSLPERVATHWGIGGQADGWSHKTVLVMVFPAVMLGLGLLLTFLPKIDPRQKEVAAHAPTYSLLINVIMVFMAGIQVMLVGVNLGWPIDIPMLIPVGVGLLLMVIGNLMPRMRPNWFMGIRTPWTLASEVVWRKTHRLGGYCFMAMGILMVAMGFVATPERFPYLLGIVISLALVPVAYSYFAWRREQEAASSSTRSAGE